MRSLFYTQGKSTPWRIRGNESDLTFLCYGLARWMRAMRKAFGSEPIFRKFGSCAAVHRVQLELALLAP